VVSPLRRFGVLRWLLENDDVVCLLPPLAVERLLTDLIFSEEGLEKEEEGEEDGEEGEEEEVVVKEVAVWEAVEEGLCPKDSRTPCSANFDKSTERTIPPLLLLLTFLAYDASCLSFSSTSCWLVNPSRSTNE